MIAITTIILIEMLCFNDIKAQNRLQMPNPLTLPHSVIVHDNPLFKTYSFQGKLNADARDFRIYFSSTIQDKDPTSYPTFLHIHYETVHHTTFINAWNGYRYIYETRYNEYDCFKKGAAYDMRITVLEGEWYCLTYNYNVLGRFIWGTWDNAVKRSSYPNEKLKIEIFGDGALYNYAAAGSYKQLSAGDVNAQIDFDYGSWIYISAMAACDRTGDPMSDFNITLNQEKTFFRFCGFPSRNKAYISGKRSQQVEIAVTFSRVLDINFLNTKTGIQTFINGAQLNYLYEHDREGDPKGYNRLHIAGYGTPVRFDLTILDYGP